MTPITPVKAAELIAASADRLVQIRLPQRKDYKLFAGNLRYRLRRMGFDGVYISHELRGKRDWLIADKGREAYRFENRNEAWT